MATTYVAPALTPADAVGAERLQQLQQQGFCVVPDMAPPALIEHTRACAERAIATQDEERLARTRSPGTLIDSDGYPELADLIGNPAALDELHRMGFTDIKFWKAVIISKPPGGPRLYWHQDCMLWQDPRSYSEVPGMIFLMYYLEDTSRHNGCLRLLPGSHRRRLDLHDLGVAHERDINSMENAADPRFLDHEGEVDVPVRAGDLVVGDARMFHAAHSNESDQRRTVITIWFYPLFGQLLEPVQSYYHSEMHRKHAEWPPDALARIAPLIPRYAGGEPPMEVHRTPDERLRAG